MAGLSLLAGPPPVEEPVNRILETVAFKVQPLKGGKGRPLRVRGRGELVLRKGQASTTVTYDPPGTGWIALGLTLAIAVAFQVVRPDPFTLYFLAKAAGSSAIGPGWVIWYLILLAWRKLETPLYLREADVEEAVLDVQKRRLAFKTTLDGRPGWIGMVFSPMPPDLVTPLRAAWNARVRVDKVRPAGVSTMVRVFVGFVGVVFLSKMITVAVSVLSQ